MSLREYQKKRDFASTPEPKGRLTRRKEQRPRYVVHRHHATRLHWDVRLEMDGVLASWAVPQGPPLEGGIRRLAVHTEDHPMQYLTFAGVIPDGYGAGTMSIWDTGRYVLDERKPKEVKITFDGEKLQGSYVIVQTTQNDGRDWLMIKHDTPPKARAAFTVSLAISSGSVSTFSSTRRKHNPSAVSRPIIPKAAWSNSTSFSCAACGA